MDILVGLFLIVFGLVITFIGIQVFFAVLPLAGVCLRVFPGGGRDS